MEFNFPKVKNLNAWLLGSGIKSYYRNRSHDEILTKTDSSLVLFENQLIDTSTGDFVTLEGGGHGRPSPEAIAAAAATLPGTDGVRLRRLLFLPSTEFVATRYELAIRDNEMLKNALELQAHTFVPAFEDELLLAVKPAGPGGTAFWFPAVRADTLFEAFKQKGLFLSAIQPRWLAAISGNIEDTLIRDEDPETLVHVYLRQGHVESFLTVQRRDLQDEHFRRQWKESCDGIRAGEEVVFASREDWAGLGQMVRGPTPYGFFPKGSEATARQFATNRRMKLAGQLSVAVILLLSFPFIGSWVRIQNLESALEEAQALAADALELQASITDIDLEWGAVSEFPRIDVYEVLMTLNDMAAMTGSLISFSVDRGVIDIQGNAQDPAYLVELLTENEAFYDIAQSRSISGGDEGSGGDRFGIRMNMTGIDFDDYDQKFPLLREGLSR